MTAFKWSAGETKSIQYAAGDTLELSGIAASQLRLSVADGQLLLAAGALGALTLTPVNGAALTAADLSMSILGEGGTMGRFILAGGETLVRGSQGGDYLLGDGQDNDTEGGQGADRLDGGDGHDRLDGGAGDDLLLGGSGEDILIGDDGKDTLDGGGGFNLLEGGLGDDAYLIRDWGDYVFDEAGADSGTITVDWYKTVESVENWSWAPGVQKLPYWIDALTHDYAPLMATMTRDFNGVIYYTFPRTPPDFFTARDRQDFLPFTDDQIDYVYYALDYIGALLNLTFEEAESPDDSFNIVFGNNRQENSGGYAQTITPSHGSPLLLNEDFLAMHPSRDDGATLLFLLLHELGHSLGLKHPFGGLDADGDIGLGPYLSAAEDHTAATVMSYTDGGQEYYDVFSPLDIAALQYLYGVSPDADSEDTVHKLDPAKSSMIWDGGGNDTIDGSGLAADLTLRLDPGYWSHIGAKADTITAAGQVTINFGSVIENAVGGTGNDALTGNAADNALDGGAGNDILSGGAGADYLSGGRGIDTAVFTGARGGYGLTWQGDALTVSALGGTDGRDTLTGIERLRFADGMVALDVGAEGVAGQVYRLYQAAFDRKPDAAGVGYWLAQADQGASMAGIADGFLRSEEFAQLHGGASPASAVFIAKLYSNVLHRAYDQAGYDYWTGALAAGASRADVLLSFAAGEENYQQVAAIIAGGYEYALYG